MAKNDSILIDGILDDRINLKLPSDQRDEAFEYFAIEQILKDTNVSSDDIKFGMVDGRDDGGIDAFFIFVNGHLLKDPDSFFWPKSSAELEVSIITCKHQESFKQAPLDNIAATLSEIFDFSIEKSDLKGDYNDFLLHKRDLLRIAYRRLSPRLVSFSVKIAYASRGDAVSVGDSILSRGKQIVKITEDLFGICKANVNFFGSTELVQLHRKIPNFSLELPFIEVLAKGERYVLLSRLSDYNRFITDESGKLRRYLLDSNVRDFMGLNRVNEDIKGTLEDEASPDFWWLNNGVTILATSARVIGKTIHIEDIQIVNGLQTTESIYRYFLSGKVDPNDRSVLVKIIVSQQKEIRDAIIRATNNQTVVELTALHATDKIQRDIEQILEKYGFYYERRTNHYSNQGIKPELIFSPLYLASGYVSLVLKSINKGANLKGRFMRNLSSYELVFSEKTPIEIWPLIAEILRKTDGVLEGVRLLKTFQAERFLKKWRHIISYLTVAKIIGKLDFSTSELLRLDRSKYTEIEIKTVWEFLHSLNQDELFKSTNIGKGFLLKAFAAAADTYRLTGYEAYEKWSANASHNEIDKKVRLEPKQVKKIQERQEKAQDKLEVSLDKAFIQEVNLALPDQPWKPGIHLEIAAKLRCTPEEIAAAINLLISSGIRYRQKDGVVYDKHGVMVRYDSERVDPITLKLNVVVPT